MSLNTLNYSALYLSFHLLTHTLKQMGTRVSKNMLWYLNVPSLNGIKKSCNMFNVLENFNIYFTQKRLKFQSYVTMWYLKVFVIIVAGKTDDFWFFQTIEKSMHHLIYRSMFWGALWRNQLTLFSLLHHGGYYCSGKERRRYCNWIIWCRWIGSLAFLLKMPWNTFTLVYTVVIVYPQNMTIRIHSWRNIWGL